MIDLFQKLSTHSKNALKNAFSLAVTDNAKNIEPKHIYFALTQEKGCIAAQILEKFSLNQKNTKTQNFSNQIDPIQIGFSQGAKKILEKAFLLACINQSRYVGTEHILLAITSINDGDLINFFQEKNVDLNEINKQVQMVLNSTAKFGNPNENFEFNDASAAPGTQTNLPASASVLDLYATDLTDSVLQQKIDPVVGRQIEIERLIQILCRRNKNNPLLLGDPGVGKTAIVEGLAKKIISQKVPSVLLGKKIYNLDISSVVAGTSFRGEFENRLKMIINEVKKNPNIILFIDEIHNLTGAGAATGSMDAANILKPALARGEIRCIGATTLDAYKKQIESDPALERRFQPILVNQPSVENTIEILNGIKQNYELFHGIKISNEAIVAAAKLSDRYIFDRFLPDKAIDLIDEAAAAKKISCSNKILKTESEILENKLKTILQKKIDLITQEKFSTAIKLKKQEQQILARLGEIKTTTKDSDFKNQNLPEITEQDIATVVARSTGIPLFELVVKERNRLLNLEKTLAQKIIGQNEAIKTIAESIRRSRAGIADANRPIGSFIFLGPSGIGKTELTKYLALSVFGSTQALVKIDMSEFAEAFNISKLIGAPAGYIGYKEGAKLTDGVKRRPYSVVLFDEIEKAHPQVFNLLLQVLEDGYLTDASGKLINFRNTIIILTSNLGSQNFNLEAAIGFDLKNKDKSHQLQNNLVNIENDVLKKLKEKFPPEFLSRIDKTIVFKPLTDKELLKITKNQLNELQARLSKQNLAIKFAKNVAPYIAKLSYRPEIGARAIRKNIQELIENPLANLILNASFKSQKNIIIEVKNNKIIFA